MRPNRPLLTLSTARRRWWWCRRCPPCSGAACCGADGDAQAERFMSICSFHSLRSLSCRAPPSPFSVPAVANSFLNPCVVAACRPPKWVSNWSRYPHGGAVTDPVRRSFLWPFNTGTATPRRPRPRRVLLARCRRGSRGPVAARRRSRSRYRQRRCGCGGCSARLRTGCGGASRHRRPRRRQRRQGRGGRREYTSPPRGSSTPPRRPPRRPHLPPRRRSCTPTSRSPTRPRARRSSEKSLRSSRGWTR